jgi:ABC-type antimicrobial peptide transport system permease subunit
VTLAARGTGHAALLARPVRHALREAAPTATVGAVQTEANLLERRLKAVRLLTALYVLLGLLATGQAAFGLYGTVSQFVSRRTAEIGVRVVFGAGTLDVVRLVVRQALTPVVAGLLLGLAASPLVARVMWAARLTGEAGWGELLAIAAGIALVMVAAFAAASVPVWRVSRMDPAAALREE